MGAHGGACVVNIYILGYLVLCLIVGLWAPRKLKVRAIVVTLAAALVLFFTLSSSKL
jgi:hypothetical protein